MELLFFCELEGVIIYLKHVYVNPFRGVGRGIGGPEQFRSGAARSLARISLAQHHVDRILLAFSRKLPFEKSYAYGVLYVRGM